ncbi:MAG: acylphosphatase [Deinococcus sp.]|nr:acylphosphatase [Deinococcus sp.]
MVAIVSGRVQGVGYRGFVRDKALALGLAGYAENLADGRVEVVAEGQLAALDSLLRWLQQGPVHARVEEMQVDWSEPTGLAGFYVY